MLKAIVSVICEVDDSKQQAQNHTDAGLMLLQWL